MKKIHFFFSLQTQKFALLCKCLTFITAHEQQQNWKRNKKKLHTHTRTRAQRERVEFGSSFLLIRVVMRYFSLNDVQQAQIHIHSANFIVVSAHHLHWRVLRIPYRTGYRLNIAHRSVGMRLRNANVRTFGCVCARFHSRSKQMNVHGVKLHRIIVYWSQS